MIVRLQIVEGSSSKDVERKKKSLLELGWTTTTLKLDNLLN